MQRGQGLRDALPIVGWVGLVSIFLLVTLAWFGTP